MVPHFASMDRINYRRLSAVYVTDMKHPENSDRTTWDYLMKGNFYFQNNDTPYTIIGRDHCRKQENKKTRDQETGRTKKKVRSFKQSKQHQRYFMATPILLQINLEMVRARVKSNSSSKPHHQLGNAYTHRQNQWVISLLHTFEKQVSLSPVKYEITL